MDISRWRKPPVFDSQAAPAPVRGSGETITRSSVLRW
jgi:hypothetical protein